MPDLSWGSLTEQRGESTSGKSCSWSVGDEDEVFVRLWVTGPLCPVVTRIRALYLVLFIADRTAFHFWIYFWTQTPAALFVLDNDE